MRELIKKLSGWTTSKPAPRWHAPVANETQTDVNIQSASMSQASLACHPENASQDHCKQLSPPQSLSELIKLLQQTPRTVLNTQERAKIATLMSLPDLTVGDLMTTKQNLPYVKESDLLTPTLMNQLYQSGQRFCPVNNKEGKIIGFIEISKFNITMSANPQPAVTIMREQLYFLKNTMTISQALIAFLQTQTPVCLVIDKSQKIVGMLSLWQILETLLQEPLVPEFEEFNNRQAVSQYF